MARQRCRAWGGFTVTAIRQDDIRAGQGERTAYSLAAVYRSRLTELEKDSREWAESMTLPSRNGRPGETPASRFALTSSPVYGCGANADWRSMLSVKARSFAE